jgi:hypothetical protein
MLYSEILKPELLRFCIANMTARATSPQWSSTIEGQIMDTARGYIIPRLPVRYQQYFQGRMKYHMAYTSSGVYVLPKVATSVYAVKRRSEGTDVLLWQDVPFTFDDETNTITTESGYIAIDFQTTEAPDRTMAELLASRVIYESYLFFFSEYGENVLGRNIGPSIAEYGDRVEQCLKDMRDGTIELADYIEMNIYCPAIEQEQGKTGSASLRIG